MALPIEFWFSIGSTYSYLTVMRIGSLARREGLDIRWRPFSVRALMVEQNNIPFRDKPIKAAYIWRDIERRAAAYGFPAKLPAPYPLREWDRVNQIAILAASEGWCESYAVETYRRWFQHGEEPGADLHLENLLTMLGRDAGATISEASGLEIIARYEAATSEARSRGLFGAPSFVVGAELFWGDDRLEDAISWAKDSRV